MLLRAGHIALAVDYINDNLAHFQSRSPGFIHYFTEYTTSPTHTLQRTTSISILADYEEMKYGNEIVDPYKTLVYKILGRCQVNSSLPALIRSSEDYLWLQVIVNETPSLVVGSPSPNALFPFDSFP
jgi:nuclear pore complex protein Nup93